MTAQQQARLVDALRSRNALSYAGSPTALLDALRATLDPVDAVILPASHRDESVQLVVREIAEHWPRIAILVYCDMTDRYSADIRGLTAAGVHQFIIAGVNDHGTVLRSVLALARRGCAAEWVMGRLETIVPARLHRMVESILAYPDRVTSIPALAAELGVHRKTLFNWCERAAFLPPAEVLAWVRLALVAHHLESTGCTIETIALELAYPSDTALRNAMKRYTGYRATEVRERGGVSVVVDALRRRIQKTSLQLHQV